MLSLIFDRICRYYGRSGSISVYLLPILYLLPHAEFRGHRSRMQRLGKLQFHFAAFRQVGEAGDVIRVLEPDISASVGRQGRRIETVLELGGDPEA